MQPAIIYLNVPHLGTDKDFNPNNGDKMVVMDW